MKANLLIFFLCSFFLLNTNAQQYKPEIFLQELTKIESLSGKEQEVVNLLEEWAITENLHVNKFVQNGISNISISLFPLELKKQNIILMSHLDVVPVMNIAEWKQDPFCGDIINDTIWGRGTIDCKGLAVMQLYALKQFKDNLVHKDLPYNITFLGVAEEETDSENGAKFIIDNYIKLLNPFVIFGEGGSALDHVIPSKPDLNIFGISVAEKNSLWLELVVYNKTGGHGAMPPALYANKKLIRVLSNLLDEKRKLTFNPLVMNMFTALGNLEGGFKGYVLRHINWAIFWPFVKSYFRPGEPFSVLVQNTFTITHIASSAETANQISDKATAMLDCRLLPGIDKEKFIKRIKRIAGNKVEVNVISETPNAFPSPLTPIYSNFEEATKEVYPNSECIAILFPASTDNNYFRLKGIPVYGIIPAKMNTELIESVHGNNERIAITDLYKGIDIYYRMLQKSSKKKN